MHKVGKEADIAGLYGDVRGVYIFDTERDDPNKLKTCFLSEIRDIMKLYGVNSFRGTFINGRYGFKVDKLNLEGNGSGYYNFSFAEYCDFDFEEEIAR